MKAKEWLQTMQQAADYNPDMTNLIEKYGEMLLDEEVERRIAEMLPSDKIIDAWLQTNRWASAAHYVTWLRSRLTENKQEGSSSEKPNNSKEGGKG